MILNKTSEVHLFESMPLTSSIVVKSQMNEKNPTNGIKQKISNLLNSRIDRQFGTGPVRKRIFTDRFWLLPVIFDQYNDWKHMTYVT